MPFSQKAVLGCYARLLGIRNSTPLLSHAMAVIAHDYNATVKKMATELGENLTEFLVPNTAFWHVHDQPDMIYTEILRTKVAQVISYLEHVYHLNQSVLEIGSLYNSIRDAELKERCSDLLSAPGNFDRVINQATQVLEDRIRKKSEIDKPLVGVSLVNTVMNSDPSKTIIRISASPEEHEGVGHICRGIMLAFRNPTHHYITDRFSREEALKLCAFVDSLLSMIDASEIVKPRV